MERFRDVNNMRTRLLHPRLDSTVHAVIAHRVFVRIHQHPELPVRETRLLHLHELVLRQRGTENNKRHWLLQHRVSTFPKKETKRMPHCSLVSLDRLQIGCSPSCSVRSLFDPITRSRLQSTTEVLPGGRLGLAPQSALTDAARMLAVFSLSSLLFSSFPIWFAFCRSYRALSNPINVRVVIFHIA